MMVVIREMFVKPSVKRSVFSLACTSVSPARQSQIDASWMHVDAGKLYIRRPGKMRLEYEAPNNALVIAGAGSVAIFDDKTKNGPTIFPLKKTPLNLLLKKDVNLMENKMISEHTEKNKNTFIVVQDPERLSQGKIEMVFSNQPILLESWTITNQSNQKTKIMLNNLHEVAKIPLYLFNITAASKIKN